jgi:glutamate/tyrosine decarboxylase-like PLP-dependent enzyme
MMYMGREGYVSAAREVMQMSKAIQKGVRSIPQVLSLLALLVLKYKY